MVAWKSGMNINEMKIVLIVSENEETAEEWERMFRQKQCHVVRESCAREAVQTARLLAPSLILLSLDLPHSALMELCAELRSTTQGALLLLAPSGNGMEVFDYYNAGVDEYLAMPINPMTVLIKSMAWLTRQVWIIPRDQSARPYA